MKPKNRSLALLIMILFFVLPGLAQDTLHLVYHHTQIKPHDSTEARIEKWAKNLNGQHMDIEVVAYFHKPEFRKFAQQRCDELYLVLNRKARALITIQSIGPKKGKDFQKTTVDIIYKKSLSPAEAAEIAAKEKAKKDEAKAEEAKKKEAEKSTKESGKKDDDKTKSKTEVAQEQTEKGDKKGKEDKKKDSGDKKGKDDEDDADYGQASSRSINWGSSTMTLDELKYVRGGKFVVAQSGNQKVDASLYAAVKQFWNFNPNVVQMPYADAIKEGKANKKDTITILSFSQVKVWHTEKHAGITIKILRIGYGVLVENSKGKILMYQPIPKEKGRGANQIDFTFGVSFLNNLCKLMNDNNLSKSGKADEFYDLRAPDLKDKTLYIAEHQLNKNLPREEVQMHYPYPVSIVSDNAWEEAIYQRKNVAYVMVVLLPTNPKLFAHYIMDAATGETFIVDYGRAGVGMGWGTPSFHPTQSGFVDKANFESYVKVIDGAVKDNQERADDKTKKIEKEKEKATKKEKADAEKKEKAEQKQKEKEAKEKK